MPSKLNIVVKIPPSQFPDGSYMTIIPDPVDPSLAPLFANSIGYVSGVSTIENVNVDVGSYLNGYAIDNLATHLNGAVITGTTVALPDTNAPTFSLSPNQTSYTITEGDAFFAPTLTLTDDVDGSSTPSPTLNNVDTSTAGNYEITWSGLSDSAGNVIEDVTVSVVVEVVSEITEVVINLRNPTANAFYSLGAAIVFAGDFRCDFPYVLHELTGAQAFCGGGSNDLFRADPFTNTLQYRIGGTFRSTTVAFVEDNELNVASIERIGTTINIYRNNIPIASVTAPVVDFTVSVLGQRDSNDFFIGELKGPKLRDITTPANSLEFKLNKLTDNFEYPVNNVFGSELVTNGDFASSVTGWSNMNAAKGTITWQATQRLRNTVDATFDAGASTSMSNAVGLHQVSMNIFCSVQSNILIRASGGGFPIFFQGILNAGNNVIFKTAVLPFANMTLEIRYTGAQESVGDYLEIDDVSVKSITNIVNYQNISEDVRDTFVVDGTKLIGSNNLVVNGDFANGSTNWILRTDSSVVDGKVVVAGGDNAQGGMYQQNFLKAGFKYQYSFSVTSYTSGVITLVDVVGAPQFSASGSFTLIGTQSNRNLAFFASNPSFLEMDNVSARRVIEAAVQYTPPPLFDTNGVLTCSGTLSCSDTIPSGE
jgi:hypothetical protein